MSKRKKREKIKAKKSLILLTIGIVLLTSVAGIVFYRTFYSKPALISELPDDGYFYVRTGEVYEDVINRFKAKNIVSDLDLLEWTMRQKNYPNNVKAGRYKLNADMSVVDITNLLRSGKQEAIRLTLRSQKNFKELALVLAEHLEPELADWQRAFDEIQLNGLEGVYGDAVYTFILPNTYQIFWNTKPQQFIERMQREHDSFWRLKGRKQKADSLGLSTADVQIMASIVQKESNKKDELQRIAGVYYNRIQKRMLLQADPTLVYILRQNGVQRVLNKDKKLDDPYNTYMYLGLPPGPICLASMRSIDAVLNLENHNYLYFCAREDFSGYHSFAETYTGHLINARRYQRALNERKIYR